jgi:hypothetical protein
MYFCNCTLKKIYIFFIGKHIFEPIMRFDNDIGEWNSAWIASGIQLPDMVYLAVEYWLSKPLTLTIVTEMLNFHRTIDTICNSNGMSLHYKSLEFNNYKIFVFIF